MNREWMQHTILRVASALAPYDQRGEWLEEWRSELWYIPRRDAMRFCLGAFRDALWLRRNNMRRAHYLESPLGCLAFLVMLAAAGIFMAVCLPGLPQYPRSPLRARDLPGECIGMFALSSLLLPAMLAVGRVPAKRHSMPWPNRLRRGIFLVLKIVLVQPIMLCGLIFWTVIAPMALFAPLGLFATWVLVFRWVFGDQQRRCPMCLRLLTNPVRIGTASETFLEWYGAESSCSRGHGLLQVSETSVSYSRKAQWLGLGDSWSGLFSAGGNHDA
jgi:hypothetical protein